MSLTIKHPDEGFSGDHSGLSFDAGVAEYPALEAGAREPLLANGFTIEGEDDEIPTVEVEEIEFPDPEKASHEAIDAFAEEHKVTYEGIEAKDAEKPTRVEKVAHIVKVIEALAAENDAHAAATGTLQ